MVKSIKLSERDFSSQVEDLLYLYQWRWSHPRPARVRRHDRDIYETAYSGHKGWLDYLAIRPPRVLVFELKDSYKKMTPEQVEWWEWWELCQQGNSNLELYLWRPSDIEEIIKCLC